MVDHFNLDNLPAVKLLTKEKLPDTAGIYFAVDESDRLLYIGKAKNINKRWANHHRYHQLEKINQKTLITLKWYECENDEIILTQLENYFIETYHPELNQTKVTSKKLAPAEIALRKTLAKISKYVVIYGYEENSETFGLPTVIVKYDIIHRNPARILRNIFDGDNRRGSLRWSYYSRRKSTPIWQTKCNGICIVVGCDYNTNFHMQNGESAALAGVSLLNVSAEDYQKTIASKDWSQSYHPNIQRYVKDPLPLLWSKNTSFDELDVEAMQRGLARQRGLVGFQQRATVEGGGFTVKPHRGPHERHRGARSKAAKSSQDDELGIRPALKVPSGRWRECAVQEAIKEFSRERSKSKLGQGRRRGSQVKVYCEAIGRGKFVIRAYQEAIEWFGGYEILGLEKADYLAQRTDAAPKWFKTHKVTVRIPEENSYRSISAPISAANHAELEQRLDQIRQLSPLHQKIKFKRQ